MELYCHLCLSDIKLFLKENNYQYVGVQGDWRLVTEANLTAAIKGGMRRWSDGWVEFSPVALVIQDSNSLCFEHLVNGAFPDA